MNDLLWKGVTKGATMYLDSERNPTTDYLIRSLRIGTPLEPKDQKQNGIRKIMLGKSINPLTRSEILEDLSIVDEPRRLVPLMYYYNWSKYDITTVKSWKRKYLYSDIDIPTEEELELARVPVNVDFIDV